MQSALLLQLLAARQGGADNPALQELLATLSASGNQTPESGMKAVLAHLEQSNPMLATLFQQMASKDKSPCTDPDRPEFPKHRSARQDYYEDSHESALALAEDLRAQAQTVNQDFALHAERLDACAAALGACGLCWGEDSTCRACRGRGKPGFSLPDEALFEEMIVPAIRMVRAHRRKPAVPMFPPQVPLTTSN